MSTDCAAPSPPRSPLPRGAEGDTGGDLAVLAELAAEGAVTVEIGGQGSWDRFDEAAEALRGRRISGKAVLEVVTQ
ncbi:hypothetical protein [Streptomyces sp. NPDC086835]|uniref:hypothetical protein n=1 Tax=Streptomyces sp. NPDC086835 TaxID=3365761 RepID=UPI0038222EA3